MQPLVAGVRYLLYCKASSLIDIIEFIFYIVLEISRSKLYRFHFTLVNDYLFLRKKEMLNFIIHQMSLIDCKFAIHC